MTTAGEVAMRRAPHSKGQLEHSSGLRPMIYRAYLIGRTRPSFFRPCVAGILSHLGEQITHSTANAGRSRGQVSFLWAVKNLHAHL